MRTSLLLVLLGWTTSVLGWGQIAHRASAEVADHYLSETSRLAVAEILGRESLARASTWPDFMRADPAEFWQEIADPWHYVTVPDGEVYGPESAPPQGDGFTALEKFSQVLRDPAADPEERALALRFVVHIIGDLHQPLHVGNGTDRGGNDFAVTYFGETSNLHQVWDRGMVDGWQLSYTELAAWLLDDITPERFAAWSNPDPIAWITESAEIRTRIYPEERDLFWRYNYAWKDTVEQRVAQSGVRLAAYLNQLFEGVAADQFLGNLRQLCGQAFAGELVEYNDSDTDLVGQPMVMHVRECSESEVRVPFHIGDDHSRTWVFTRTENGLRLKHDHRHEDGSEDEVTQYGGDSNGVSANEQSFPADAWTRELIPYAANNIWTVVVIPGEVYSYRLRRTGTDRRFRVDFDLSTEVATPPPPWGSE